MIEYYKLYQYFIFNHYIHQIMEKIRKYNFLKKKKKKVLNNKCQYNVGSWLIKKKPPVH